jgi:hypothetical protein
MIVQEILAIVHKYYITFMAATGDFAAASFCGRRAMGYRRLAGRFCSGASIGATFALKFA